MCEGRRGRGGGAGVTPTILGLVLAAIEADVCAVIVEEDGEGDNDEDAEELEEEEEEEEEEEVVEEVVRPERGTANDGTPPLKECLVVLGCSTDDA